MKRRRKTRSGAVALAAAAALPASGACALDFCGVRSTPSGLAALLAERGRVPIEEPFRELSSTSSPDIAFALDGVLGTSMDLVTRGATAAQAHDAYRAALAEIDRLSAIAS